jgi:hypothetical protein
MRILRKRITTPGIDAVVMALLGWSLLDVAAVGLSVNPVFGRALIVVGVLCFVIALISWRRCRVKQ